MGNAGSGVFGSSASSLEMIFDTYERVVEKAPSASKRPVSCNISLLSDDEIGNLY